MSSFFGIELGKRVLSAFQYAMNISSHNVSNAQTQGFHRQTAVFSATDPYPMPVINRSIGPYQLGTGVEVVSVKRYYDLALERRILNLQPETQYQAMLSEYLGELEATNILNNGITTNLDEFFAAWQNVSNSPEDVTQRGILIQKGVELSNKVNSFAQAIIDERTDVNDDVRATVTDVNNLLSQIRDLNATIRQVVAGGDTANDLMDQRDYALSQLSQYVDFQTNEGSLGAINVYIGGRVVVQDDQMLSLALTQNPLNSNYYDVKYADYPAVADPNVPLVTGKLKALLDLRDSTTTGLMYFKNMIDVFATQFINTVNQQQAAGYDLAGGGGYVGVWPPAAPVVGDFFFNDVVAGEPALNMSMHIDFLDPLNGPQLVRASATAAGVPGDGANALALADLANFPVIIGAYSPGAFITNLYGTLGSQVQAANANKEANDDLLVQLEAMRDSVSSVSTDEEAANMLTFQKAYQAGAKIISYYNDMFDVLFAMVE